MKHSAAVAHFRQLCCLGLGGEAVMPALLAGAHALIPSEANAFHWADASGRMARFDPEYVLPEVVDALVSDFDNLVESALLTSFQSTMRFGRPVGNLLGAFTADFYRTPLYQEIYRPYNLHHALDGLVRDGFGQGLGALLLARCSNEPDFNAREMDLLARVLPYVAHAMQDAGSAANEKFVETGETGLLIVDAAGQLTHANLRGRELVYLATRPDGMAPTRPPGMGNVPPTLLRICDNLRQIFHGREAPPPVLCVQNRSGRFVFRASWLDPNSAAAESLIGVLVRQQEPVSLAMMRRMQTARLSAKQEEVCMLLARDKSLADIARTLGTSITTAKDHVIRAYAKLGVHSRDEMLRCLQAGTGGLA